MNNTKTIFISLGVVIANNVIGHFFAPNGIMFTPIVLIVISFLIGILNKELKPIWKSAILAGLVSIHDIGIKLYAGGTHDYEGLGWVHSMLFIGLLPAFVLLIIGVFRAKNETKFDKWVAVVLFPVLICIHLLLFSDLGLGRHYWYDWN